MGFVSVSSRIYQSLVAQGQRSVIEDVAGRWRLTADELLRSAGLLFGHLQSFAGRPFIAYLNKSQLYYVFTSCAFLYGFRYCPLDTNNPIQRVLDVASQLPNSLILCDSDDAFRQLRDRTERCIQIGASIVHTKTAFENHRGNIQNEEGRYYIATSGSTGIPKLVDVPHNRTLPFIDWAIPFYCIDHSCRWAQFSSVGFDLSLVDFLSVICGGGTLVSLCDDIDRLRPAEIYRERQNYSLALRAFYDSIFST